MIRHIVMWKLKGSIEERRNNAEKAAEMLNNLSGKISSLKKIESYINGTDGSEGNWDLVLDSLFDDYAGLSAYQTDPLHKEVGKFIGEVKAERSCVDFEM